MKAEIPPPGTITARQFCNLQSRAGIQGKELAERFGLKPDTIVRYRNGSRHAPRWLVDELRKMGNVPGVNVDHLDLQIRSYLRYFGPENFPHLCPEHSAIDRTLTDRIVNRRMHPS